MKIAVLAVGRMKAGLERDLAHRYFDRFAKAGGALGLDFSGVSEIAESRAATADERRRDEGDRLRTVLVPGSALILFDEHGKNLPSQAFATALVGLRDGGRRSAALAIGGPDGHDGSLRDQAELVLSFGALTWPHQLCRILLAEQLYRAATILAGHPYHRA